MNTWDIVHDIDKHNLFKLRCAYSGMILGIVGTSKSGREGLRIHLADIGFVYVSLLDQMSTLAQSQGLATTPGVLLEFENRMRQRMGATIFLQQILAQMKGKHVIIDHIRHPEEIAMLRKLPQVTIVGIYSPSDLRIIRELRNARLSNMREFDLPESYLESPQQLLADQIDACLHAVDVSIPYDTALVNIITRVDEVIEDLQLKAKNGPAFV